MNTREMKLSEIAYELILLCEEDKAIKDLLMASTAQIIKDTAEIDYSASMLCADKILSAIAKFAKESKA